MTIKTPVFERNSNGTWTVCHDVEHLNERNLQFLHCVVSRLDDYYHNNFPKEVVHITWLTRNIISHIEDQQREYTEFLLNILAQMNGWYNDFEFKIGVYYDPNTHDPSTFVYSVTVPGIKIYNNDVIEWAMPLEYLTDPEIVYKIVEYQTAIDSATKNPQY